MEVPQRSALGELYVGDVVFAAKDLLNDGTHPTSGEGALLAPHGARGVVVRIGHPEDQPDLELFLVRFENALGALGPPIGCWPDELLVETDRGQVHHA